MHSAERGREREREMHGDRKNRVVSMHFKDFTLHLSPYVHVSVCACVVRSDLFKHPFAAYLLPEGMFVGSLLIRSTATISCCSLASVYSTLCEFLPHSSTNVDHRFDSLFVSFSC